ncbi:MAG: response regulator [Candidatus Omnitrophota bacterium]
MSEIRLKIVVADDDLVVQTILEKGLTAEGHTVFLAVDGQEALKKIDTEKPDLVILDIMMPKLDGIQVLQYLRATPRTRNLPVIMLTSKSQDEDLLKGYGFGADYYVTKPFELETVLSGIRMLLGTDKFQRKTWPFSALVVKLRMQFGGTYYCQKCGRRLDRKYRRQGICTDCYKAIESLLQKQGERQGDKEEKPQSRKNAIFGAIIVSLFLILIVGIVGSYLYHTRTSKKSNPTTNSTGEFSFLEITTGDKVITNPDITSRFEVVGQYVAGKIKNISKKRYVKVPVTIRFYDADEHVTTTGVDYIPDLAPGETRDFKVSNTDSKSVFFEIGEIKGWE